LLNDYLYCPRRAALKLIEGWREFNEHTERGDIVHEHSDLPGYEIGKGVTLLRALPVFSDRLRLNGKCDIVEVEFRSSATPRPGALSRETVASLKPVEFKLGKRRKWENDDAQLCAQALCLEEMLGLPVPRGAVFHADSKRRRDVEFTLELRSRTEAAVLELHQLLASGTVPLATFKPACEHCSLHRICLPELTSRPPALARAAESLFEV
jgi:CRISPR-associated exonuclease Cas4